MRAENLQDRVIASSGFHNQKTKLEGAIESHKDQQHSERSEHRDFVTTYFTWLICPIRETYEAIY